MSAPKPMSIGEKMIFDPLNRLPAEIGERTRNAFGKGVYGILTCLKGGQMTTLVLHGLVGQIDRKVVHREQLVVSTREAYLELLEAANEPMTAAARAHKYALRAYYRFRLPLGDRRSYKEIAAQEQFSLGLDEAEYIRQALLARPGNAVLRFMQMKGKINSHRAAMEKYGVQKARRTRDADAKYGALIPPVWEGKNGVSWEDALGLEQEYLARVRQIGGPPELPADPNFYEVRYADQAKQATVSDQMKVIFNPVTFTDQVRSWKPSGGGSTIASGPGEYNPSDFDGLNFEMGPVPPIYTFGADWSADKVDGPGAAHKGVDNPVYEKRGSEVPGKTGGPQVPPRPGEAAASAQDAEDDALQDESEGEEDKEDPGPLSDEELLEVFASFPGLSLEDLSRVKQMTPDERRAYARSLAKQRPQVALDKPSLTKKWVLWAKSLAQ